MSSFAGDRPLHPCVGCKTNADLSTEFEFGAPSGVASRRSFTRVTTLRVRIQKTADLKYDTDLLIDQIRAISNARFMFRYCTVSSNLLKKVEVASRSGVTRVLCFEHTIGLAATTSPGAQRWQ